jgi:hypothetical protein
MKKATLFLCAIFPLFFSCQPAASKTVKEQQETTFDETAETDAIMKVIEAETNCFYEGNYECWASHWSHKEYAIQAWNNSDGSSNAAIGWEKINAQGKGWIEEYYKNGEVVIHPVVKRDKPLVKFFNDKTAYLTYTQYNADQEKKFYRTSQEIRIMEKEDDGWKIVNVSAFWDGQKAIPFDSLQVN